MNQFFNTDRFALVVSKHWADNQKRYGLAVIAFFGLMITWFIFTMVVGLDRHISGEMQRVTYFFPLFVLGTFYASQYFSDLSSRPKGSNFILVPASTFEKSLCGILYTVVLFFLVYTSIFYIVDFVMVNISNAYFGANTLGKKTTVINVFNVSALDETNDTHDLKVLVIFFALQSVFLLGSVLFNKYNFIKTVISGFLCGLFLFTIAYLLHNIIPALDEPQIPELWLSVLLFFFYSIAPILYIVTYYRLKQKQV